MKTLFRIMATCLLLAMCSVTYATTPPAKKSVTYVPLKPAPLPAPVSADNAIKVMSLGSQLPYVIATKDEEIQAATKARDEVAADYEKRFNSWFSNPDGEIQRHVKYGEDLTARCPAGAMRPIAEANACNAEIDAFNKEDNRLVQVVKRKVEEKDQAVASKQAEIDRITAEKQKLADLRETIAACLDGDVMQMKACLDQLYDGVAAATSQYNLDASVVKPGAFGTKHVDAQAAIRAYRASGNDKNQIQKIMRHKIVVPKP